MDWQDLIASLEKRAFTLRASWESDDVRAGVERLWPVTWRRSVEVGFTVGA